MTTKTQSIKQQIKTIIRDKKLQSTMLDIFFHHIEDMVFVMENVNGTSFRYLFVNAAALKFAGISNECIGKTMQEVLPEEKSRFLKDYYLKAVKTKEPVIFQDGMIEYNGERDFGETIITPVCDQAGKIIYVIGITRVITAAMLEKERIIINEQMYRSLVDHNMDAILSVDFTGKILNINPSTTEMTGYYPEDFKGYTIFDYFRSIDHLKVKNVLSKALLGCSVEMDKCTFIHQKGHTIQVQLKSVPMIVHDEIIGVYFIMRDLSEQVRNTEKIKYMAYHDQLTGLFNRATLLKDLHKITKKAMEQNKEFSLIYIDLDRFKLLNDSFGHHSGDAMLKQVGERLCSLRDYHYSVYRQGGDEFVILLEDIDRDGTSEFIKELTSRLEAPFHVEGDQYYVTASMGISVFPYDGIECEQLMHKADNALFQVKQRGRAHYLFYSSTMSRNQFPNPFIMDTSLRKAIEKKELAVYYQPQINLRTKQTTGFEALLRWNHSKLGYIPPAEFIPVAEDTGLIIPIGEWVLEEVCKQINEWNRKGFQTKVAVNLSPKQFQQPDIVKTIQRYMDQYQVSSKSLEIEITEGTIQDTKETNETLKQMKKLGLSISVDDFGTGYSSLSYLKHFPLNTLKIDRSFIRELLSDQKDAAITETIIHLGHSLGLEVVAEGVETKEQAEFLLNFECEKAQGFYFSKPLPAFDVEEQFLKKV